MKKTSLSSNSVLAKMSIGYFADGPWAQNALRLFLDDEEIEIKFICPRYNQPDRELERMAVKHGIDLIKNRNINSAEFIVKVEAYDCDLFVSLSFNQIFKKQLIYLPPYSTINCHAGKLPFYRGRNILNWCLINDGKEFGITVHYIDEGIDTGDIILQRCFPITDQDTYATILDRAHIECANLLYSAVKQIHAGTADRIPQSIIHSVGFYCGKRKPGDEIINWKDTSRSIFNLVRAVCSPGPMALSYLNGEVIRINKVKLVPDAPTYKGIPGQVIGESDEGFLVKTKDSFIKVVEYQYSGTIRMGNRFSGSSNEDD